MSAFNGRGLTKAEIQFRASDRRQAERLAKRIEREEKQQRQRAKLLARYQGEIERLRDLAAHVRAHVEEGERLSERVLPERVADFEKIKRLRGIRYALLREAQFQAVDQRNAQRHAVRVAKYQKVIRLREQGMTLQQIGNLLGVTRQRVEQIIHSPPPPPHHGRPRLEREAA